MCRVLVKDVACGPQGSTGLPDPLVLPGHSPTKRGEDFQGHCWGWGEGQAGRGEGRTELRTSNLGTDSSHLDSNLGSGCFSFVTSGKLFNPSQLLSSHL